MSKGKRPFYTPRTGKIWQKLKPAVRSLRQESTVAEDILWAQIRDRQLGGLKFRRQHAIGRFVVDFYCAEASLVIEVDGSIHDNIRAQDAQRQEILENLGLHVLRFSNDDVLHHMDTIVETIREEYNPG